MAVNRFNNNMFQFEDFDMSGIMNPELVDIMEMRKEANLARGNATDQYEADVADFKNIQATEAEQGIASLPTAPTFPSRVEYTPAPVTTPTNFFPNVNQDLLNDMLRNGEIGKGLDFDIPLIPETENFGMQFDPPGQYDSPNFNLEDIDFTNIPNIPTFVDNPYTEVFDTPTPEPDPFANLPDLGVYDFDINDFIDPVVTDLPLNDPNNPFPNDERGGGDQDYPFDPGMGDVIDVDIPVTDTPVTEGGFFHNLIDSNSPLRDYPFVDPETGGDLVLVIGTPDNPGPGVVVRDPETGELPPGFTDEGPVYPPGTTPPTRYIPPPPPPVRRPYETVIPYERPLDNVNAGYTRPMDPSLFGSTPGFENSPLRQQPTGMKGGGRVPMGNNNMLNSGLSRLPLNQQNDTLTQVFQSGFRPRR